MNAVSTWTNQCIKEFILTNDYFMIAVDLSVPGTVFTLWLRFLQIIWSCHWLTVTATCQPNLRHRVYCRLEQMVISFLNQSKACAFKFLHKICWQIKIPIIVCSLSKQKYIWHTLWENLFFFILIIIVN